jgi:hypothetical protein
MGVLSIIWKIFIFSETFLPKSLEGKEIMRTFALAFAQKSAAGQKERVL